MYLLENSIMTLDFKSHTALTMVIILFLYFKYFLYPTHRAAAPLLYSCSAMNFWSVLWLPYVFMELHKYITILWKEIQNGCTVPVIIAELMLYRMCSVFSKLTFFFPPPLQQKLPKLLPLTQQRVQNSLLLLLVSWFLSERRTQVAGGKESSKLVTVFLK